MLSRVKHMDSHFIIVQACFSKPYLYISLFSAHAFYMINCIADIIGYYFLYLKLIRPYIFRLYIIIQNFRILLLCSYPVGSC